MSSDSASGRSNGMRLFSAMAAVRNRIAANGWRKMPHAGRKPEQHARLLLRDRVEIDRAVDQDQAEHREPHRELVRDHLRAGAQRAQQRELVADDQPASIAPMIVDAAEREDDEQARIEARDLQRIGAVAEPGGERGHAGEQRARIERAAEGNDREHEQHRHEHDPRRDRVGETVVGVGLEVFLQQHLESVGQAVEQAQPHELDLRERNAHIGAVGADAIGHDRPPACAPPTSGPCRTPAARHRVADEHDVDDEVLHHRGHASRRRPAPANSASASATDGFFGKARLERAHHALRSWCSARGARSGC